ncbi:MAG: phage head-tail connector protein [Ignavibacteriaceae bacterium]|nr:phage head-tail connector protein [Ignavibacteriaceae bacterium]
MRYSVTTTAPTYYPVTLAECKDALEITDTAHDDKITIMLQAATNEAESYTGRFYAQRTATLYYDDVVTYYRLPVSPVRSITSIETLVNESYAAFTDFEADLDDVPPLVRFKSLPSVDDSIKAVKFTLEVGFASDDSPATADLVPDAIKQAIIFHVYQSFLTRGEMSDTARNTFRNMLHPYRVLGL